MENKNLTEGTFPALLFRMRNITRWSLMRGTQQESLSEHTLQCALLAHFLGAVGNARLGGDYNCERLCALALYHDASEILTGDMPTPVKYYDERIRDAYKNIEQQAGRRLLNTLPPELQGQYAGYIEPKLPNAERKLLRAADKLCAYIRCLEERQSGNREFEQAELSIRAELDAMDCPELKYFLDHCIEAFTLPIDLLNSPKK